MTPFLIFPLKLILNVLQATTPSSAPSTTVTVPLSTQETASLDTPESAATPVELSVQEEGFTSSYTYAMGTIDDVVQNVQPVCSYGHILVATLLICPRNLMHRSPLPSLLPLFFAYIIHYLDL